MTASSKLKKIFVKILKIIGWTSASVIALLIILILIIRIPAVQNKIVQKAVTYLQDKIGTPVSLRSVTLSFPKKVVLNDLYLQDQSQDTLIFASELVIDIDMFGLLHNNIQLNTVSLEGTSAFITRNKADSTYNFDYIVDAFASKGPVDTTAAPWKFYLGLVKLEKVSLSYVDSLEGDDAQLKIGSLAVSMDRFDLDKSIFKAGAIRLSDSRIRVNQTVTKSTDTKPTNNAIDTLTLLNPLDIGADDIEINRVDFSYAQNSLEEIRLSLGEVVIEANTIDINKNIVDLEKVEMKQSFIAIRQEPVLVNDSSPGDGMVSRLNPSPLDIGWSVKVGDLSLVNDTFKYDLAMSPSQSSAIDFNHLLISSVNVSASDIALERTSAKALIRNLSFHEKSGFSIESLSTDLMVDEKRLSVRKFLFKSGRSFIDMNATASFTSLKQLIDHVEKSKFDLQVRKSTIALQDIRAIIPSVVDSLPIRVPSDSRISIDANLKGTVGDLSVSKLSLQMLDSTWLEAHGTLKGLPNIERTFFDVSLDKFYTIASDIDKVLPDSLRSDSIQFPKWTQIKGQWKGTLTTPDAKATIKSSTGDVDFSGKFDFGQIQKYQANIKVVDLNLREILRDTTFGKVSLSGDVKGVGENLKDLDAIVNLVVQNFNYNQYLYKDLKVNGSVKKNFFSGSATLADENLDFSLVGEIDRNKKIPSYQLVFNLNNADFKALHFSETTLKGRGTAVMNITTNNFKAINGTMHIRNAAIYNGRNLYKVDSILFESVDKKDSSTFTVQSDILAANFKANFNLFELPLVIKQHVNNYFPLQDKKIVAFQGNKHFTFDLAIKNTDILTEVLLPDLKKLTPGKISGEFDSDKQLLEMDIHLSKIQYTELGMDSLVIKVRSDKKALNYSFRLKRINFDTLKIDELQLGGKIAHDSINTKLTILDSLAKEKYVLGGVIRSQENRFRFHFIPKEVMLNYEEWTVPDDNYLQFGHSGIAANNFRLSKDKERIEVVTEEKTETVSLEFQDVQLSNLTRIVAGIVPASGIINGDFKITTAKQGEFGSKLIIHDLNIAKKAFGDVTLSLHYLDDRYNVEILQKSEGSDLAITGYYIAKKPLAEFDLDVNLKPLDLQLVEPLTFGQLKKMTGQAFGTIKLTGSFKKPSIHGDISFKNAKFTPKALGSEFNLQEEKISFDQSGIVFNNFTLRDTKNQQASVRGNIRTKNYKDFDLDLRIISKDFQVLNSTADDSELYYGNVGVNADIKVTGTSKEPVLTMKISLSDNSQLTYVIPVEEKTVLDQSGIVRFVDHKAVRDPFLKDVAKEDSTKNKDGFLGMDLTATIELTDKDVLNIVIDPITGDRLSVQGNSTLILESKANGEINLSGRYEITKGSYDFSFYKLVKRQFIIDKGGSISWSGDPLKAAMDIRATYTVNTTPLELLPTLATQGSTEYNTARQQLPFYVYLKLKGELLKPEISFQLDMADNKKGAFGGAIYSKLQDINTRESDLNKQVFALLILKRFIADNPLESQAGAGVADATRQSVGRLLSDQLNRLAENVKGVQLNLNIKSYEDYSTGVAQGQTKVQLGVQKNLLNDRLVVKLSGNVDVEGQNTNNSPGDYIGDLALEYKLTTDGRLRITGFRTSNYDMISGELTETGTGLIYIKDYDTLKELFRANDAKSK